MNLLSLKLLLAVAFFGLLAPGAHAIVVFGGDSGHHTDPGGGVPWDTVGMVTDPGITHTAGSAVHIGGGWMLSAFHVSTVAGSVTFDGTSTFSIDTGFTPVQISNAGSNTDMQLFRLTTTPPAAVELYDNSFGLNEDQNTAVHMVGWGFTNDPADTNTTDGYDWLSATVTSKTWATNETVSGLAGEPAQVGFFSDGSDHYDYLYTVFGDSEGPDEGGIASFDSGSGLFANISGSWKLVGIATAEEGSGDNRSIAGLDPGPSYGGPGQGDISWYVRVGNYTSEIQAAGAPEPTSMMLLLIGASLLVTRRSRPGHAA